MRYSSFDQFLAKSKAKLAKGPIALVLAEDDVEIDTTLRHHLDIGFSPVILLAASEIDLPADVEAQIHRIDAPVFEAGLLQNCVNRLIEAAPSVWIFYCYNAEYLFFPFLESRQIGEMLSFHMEERRDAMVSYVVDI